MTCERFTSPDGRMSGFVCVRDQRQVTCSDPSCDARATRLCDYPVTSHESGTCDKPLCWRHAVKTRPGIDHCPPHARHEMEQCKLPGVD